MPFNILRKDISTLDFDAIVNVVKTATKSGSFAGSINNNGNASNGSNTSGGSSASNGSSASGGGSTSGGIFRAAGAENLSAACAAHAPIKAGEAFITSGFALPAKHIIHTAAPTYRDGMRNAAPLLRACYINSLNLAQRNGCESIAFPIIKSALTSTARSKSSAYKIAKDTISEWLKANDIDMKMDISLVVYGKISYPASKSRQREIKKYIKEYFIREPKATESSPTTSTPRQGRHLEKHTKPAKMDSYLRPAALSATIANRIGKLETSFSTTLFQLIAKKGMTSADVWKDANIDYKLFSKMRNIDYQPSKNTAIALAMALKLTLDETQQFLQKAGFTLSHSIKSDVIVECFIVHGWYKIDEINEVLDDHKLSALGARSIKVKRRDGTIWPTLISMAK